MTLNKISVVEIVDYGVQPYIALVGSGRSRRIQNTRDTKDYFFKYHEQNERYGLDYGIIVPRRLFLPKYNSYNGGFLESVFV